MIVVRAPRWCCASVSPRFGAVARLALTAAAALLSVGVTTVRAQSVHGCPDSWFNRAEYVLGQRSFGEGAVRVTWLDTEEPAAAPSWVHITHWVEGGEDGPGYQACAIFGTPDGHGFSGVDLEGIQASTQTALRVVLTVPVTMPDADFAQFRPAVLTLEADSTAGTLRAGLDGGALRMVQRLDDGTLHLQ